MALTDPRLFAVLVALSIVAFSSLLVLWRKLAGRGFIPLVLRALSLLVINLLIISSIGVALNNYGQFYSSWHELLGQREKPPLIVDSPLTKVSKQDIERGHLTKGGSLIIRRIVRGDASGITAEIYVSLPPSFVNSLRNGESNHRQYPVIAFLSGYPGYETAWIKGMKVVEREDRLVTLKKMPEVISVFPQVNVAGRFDSECMNVNGGPQVESWLSQDVPAFITQWLNISKRPWSLVGYSTGGWCSTMLTLRHPDQFSAAASIAGYYRPTPARQVTSIEKARLESEYDLYSLLKIKKPNISLFIVNSLDDTGSHISTDEFLKEAKKYVGVSEVVLKGAGHNFNAWKQVVDPILIWLGSKSAKVNS